VESMYNDEIEVK